MLKFDRKQQDSVKQLSFIKKINLKKSYIPRQVHRYFQCGTFNQIKYNSYYVKID